MNTRTGFYNNIVSKDLKGRCSNIKAKFPSLLESDKNESNWAVYWILSLIANRCVEASFILDVFFHLLKDTPDDVKLF